MSDETIKQLQKKIEILKGEVRTMQRAAERRNIELDAMHYVWCSGGCTTGTHRCDGKGPDEVTEEIVEVAERNAKRLRTWWTNRQGKLLWRVEVKD
jgi:hypothetical protein